MTARLSDDDSALVADRAAANRPALVETWIQESPDLATLIGDELLHDREWIDCLRRLCANAYIGYGDKRGMLSMVTTCYRLCQLVRQRPTAVMARNS